MKRIILFTLGICLILVQLVLAQTGKATEPKVPAAVLDAFKAKYPNMKVMDWDWEADKNAYEADFKMNGKEMEASFSADGKWMKTKTQITKNQLPAAVSKALSTGEYSTWAMDDYAEIEMADKKKMYKVDVKKGVEEFSLKYDANGTLVDKKDKKKKNGKMEKQHK